MGKATKASPLTPKPCFQGAPVRVRLPLRTEVSSSVTGTILNYASSKFIQALSSLNSLDRKIYFFCFFFSLNWRLQLVSNKLEILKTALLWPHTLKTDSPLQWDDWSQSESYNKKTNTYILLKLLCTIRRIKNRCIIMFNPLYKLLLLLFVNIYG